MLGLLKCWRDAHTDWVAASSRHGEAQPRYTQRSLGDIYSISNALVYVLVYINFIYEYSVQGIVIIWILRSIDLM